MAKAVGASASNAATAVKTSASNAAFAGKQVINSGIYQARAIGTAVGAKARRAKTTLKNKAIDLVANATDPLVKAYQKRKADQAIKKYTQGGGGSGASQHRTRYISDIKHNRRRLYDREREIIQSIRNFENNNNRKESRHHKTRKLRNILMRR